jgi:hypothetical protein
MDLKKIETLKHNAQVGKPIDPSVVLELANAYEQVVLAETFWSDRAPRMNDELLILRQLEAPARAHAVHEPKHPKAKAFAPVLAELDALRAVGKGAA